LRLGLFNQAKQSKTVSRGIQAAIALCSVDVAMAFVIYDYIFRDILLEYNSFGFFW